MQPFTHFVGIDWSGAKGKRHKGLMVALCGTGQATPVLISPPSGQTHWGRVECGAWIGAGCGLPEGTRVLIGIDAAFGMPFIDQQAYFLNKGVAENAPDLWSQIANQCRDAEDYFGGPFVELMSEHYQQNGGRKGQHYSRRMRVTENHCRDARIGPCESVFNLVGASQVGKSALSTMNMLDDLQTSSRVSIWPFHDTSHSPICLVEIYAAVFAKLGQHRGKMNDLDTLNAALLNLNTDPYNHALPGKPDDAADALVTAAGLRFIADDRKYWHPPKLSTMVRRTEGWIFGVV